MQVSKNKVFSTFREFYPFYLSQHMDRTCRRLHFIGTLLSFVVLSVGLVFQKWGLLPVVPVVGYGLSWIGHFCFEKNKPATFKYPVYSFMGDMRLFREIALGERKF